jgi:hypothetical protein
VSKSSGLELSSVVVEALGELTPYEEIERHQLELRVERGFREAVAALRSLRDKRLYRSTHKTFEEYCQGRFGYNRSRSYQLIDAAIVVDNLKECPQFVDILPTNESQCRWLTGFMPEQQRIIWGALVEEGLHPTGTSVKNKAIELEKKGIVERLREKPLIPATNFCSVGDVFSLIRLQGSERKYNGCWAVASHLNDFTLRVDVHNATILVKPENLKPIDEPDVRRQLPQILNRIRRLRECGLLDRCAYTVLDSLGRQTYLTPLEDKFLKVMEQEYGIND